MEPPPLSPSSRADAAEARVAAIEARAFAAEAAARASAEEAAAARAGEATQAKRSFFDRFCGMASSGANDSKSNVDEGRRRAPKPVSVESATLLERTPLASGIDIDAAWRGFVDAHAREWAPPTGNFKENAHVHPTVERVLAAVVPRAALRVWRRRSAEDDVCGSDIEPDFSLTTARDAAPALLAALVVVEVKLPVRGGLAYAESQTRIYLRRRLYRACCDLDARGERLDWAFAMGVATDGVSLSLVYMRSGAPAPGDSFVDATPCPVSVSEALPLFPGWDFRAPLVLPATAPPAGFVALARLCATAPGELGVGTPLSAHLRADVVWAVRGGAAEPCELELGDRLGCGGSSDVYACAAPAAAAAAGSTGLFAKVPRFVTSAVRAAFDAEATSLFELRAAADSGLVPTLVGVGERSRAADKYMADRVGAWPLLVLQPCGMPLAEWVGSRAATAAVGGGLVGAARERRACADAVAVRLLDALTAVHDAGWIHCDVRPHNIVVVGDAAGGAMLVDFGCAARRSDASAGRGVPAFAARGVFLQDSYAARPAQDAVGALLTWVAVAYGAGCAAPWLEGVDAFTDALVVVAARDDWLRRRSDDDAALGHVLCAIGTIEMATPAFEAVACARAALTALAQRA